MGGGKKKPKPRPTKCGDATDKQTCTKIGKKVKGWCKFAKDKCVSKKGGNKKGGNKKGGDKGDDKGDDKPDDKGDKGGDKNSCKYKPTPPWRGTDCSLNRAARFSPP